MFCPNCGNELKEGATFCGNCGTKAVLTEDEPASLTPAPKKDDKSSKFLIIAIVFFVTVLCGTLLGLWETNQLPSFFKKDTPTTSITSTTASTTKEETTKATTVPKQKIPCYICGVMIEENIFAGHNICKNCIEDRACRIDSCATKKQAKKEFNDEYNIITCYHCGKKYYCLSGIGDSYAFFYSVCPHCQYRNL